MILSIFEISPASRRCPAPGGHSLHVEGLQRRRKRRKWKLPLKKGISFNAFLDIFHHNFSCFFHIFVTWKQYVRPAFHEEWWHIMFLKKKRYIFGPLITIWYIYNLIRSLIFLRFLLNIEHEEGNQQNKLGWQKQL